MHLVVANRSKQDLLNSTLEDLTSGKLSSSQNILIHWRQVYFAGHELLNYQSCSLT